MHRHRLGVIVLLLLPIDSALGQSSSAGREGDRVILPRGREIALARSAAPADVSDSATVIILTERGFEVAEKGTNGVTCVVIRSFPKSLEPSCYDAEAAATVLPIELRRTELLRRGHKIEEVDREIGQGLLTGKYRLPTRPAMCYMMSSAQVLYNDDGKHVGQWQPHLMIYYPGLTAAQLGLTGPPSPKAAIVVDEGRPLSNIMVVVRSFVDPRR